MISFFAHSSTHLYISKYCPCVIAPPLIRRQSRVARVRRARLPRPVSRAPPPRPTPPPPRRRRAHRAVRLSRLVALDPRRARLVRPRERLARGRARGLHLELVIDRILLLVLPARCARAAPRSSVTRARLRHRARVARLATNAHIVGVGVGEVRSRRGFGRGVGTRSSRES